MSVRADILWASGVAGLVAGLAAAGAWVSGSFPAPADPGLAPGLAALGSCAGLLVVGVVAWRTSRAVSARIERAVPGVAEQSAWWLRPALRAAEARTAASERSVAAAGAKLREAEVRLTISEAERRYGEQILDSLKDAVIVTDPFNELTLANASAARLLGFDAGEAAHRSMDEVISDATLRQHIREVQQSRVVPKHKRLEHSMEPASGEEAGSTAVFDVTIAALPGVKAEQSGVVTILRDVTREKEINQMKSDFVSQASHELRTPLASINAYVEMLLDSEASDEATRQEFYNVIKGEADRLSRMIDNMLNISRIEAGIVSVDWGEVDFAATARSIIEMMKPQAAKKNIMLIEKIGPLIYSAEADKDMMHQVVMNLVSNAIKYTPEGGRVTVAVENDEASRSVMVSISDTGLGIPPDAIPRLFEKFFRVENYKRLAKGTGLGLNLVRHIVETVHQGKVGVESEIGHGSRFWFTIPYEFQAGGRA